MTLLNLHVGDHIELNITDIAFGGDGVGHIDGFVVFVPFVIVGERVEAEIVEVKKRYAQADLVRVINPSTNRVEPRCRYYTQCAGCQYQHIDYPHQLELQRKQIRDIFQRLGGMAEPPIEPVVASPRPYGYRNKIVLHGSGNLASKHNSNHSEVSRPGFWSVRGRSLIQIETCPIARDEINEKIGSIYRGVGEKGSVLESLRQQSSDHVTIRCNSAGQVWCFTEDNPEGNITETVLGKTLQAPLDSFFQINQEVAALALEHVSQVFVASGCTTVVDAYCGVGLFALQLADLAEHCYGIEISKISIAAANRNASLLGLTNCDFYPGRTERLLFYTLRQCHLDQTCLILDPPRSGCSISVLKTLKDQRPRKIIYVSCAPPMLARDIKKLVAMGYSLERVRTFDMFPQTRHCEAVAELRP